MKTRSKLLLAAVSLLTVSVAATATSAYAWYTANRQVTATVNSLGVHSTTGTLMIEHDTAITQTSTDSTQVIKSESGADLTYTTTSTLTDVSSQGNGTFIKPKWDATGSAADTNCVGVYDQSDANDPNKTVTLYGNETAYGVVSLGVKFTNKGIANVSDDMVLYLDPTVTVSATQNTGKMSSDSVINSARFSICTVNGSAVDSVYLYGNPKSKVSGSNEGNKYVSSAVPGKVSTTDIDTKIVIDQENFIGKDKVTDPTVGGNKDKSKGYLCTIPAGQSVSYLITMWVEGTDVDCKFSTTGADSFAVSGLSINLGFYALTTTPTHQDVTNA